MSEASERFEKIKKARAYVKRCEEHAMAAMHCEDAVFENAKNCLRRAKLRLAELEKSP